MIRFISFIYRIIINVKFLFPLSVKNSNNIINDEKFLAKKKKKKLYRVCDKDKLGYNLSI